MRRRLRSAAPAARRPLRRLGEIEHVRTEERRPPHGDRLDQVLSRPAAAGCRRRTRHRRPRSSPASRPSNRRARRRRPRAPGIASLRRTNGMPRSRSSAATAPKALRMARHDDRQRAAAAADARRAHRGSAPPRRRASSPRPTRGASSPKRAELAPQRQRRVGDADIELEIAGDHRRARAECAAAVPRRPPICAATPASAASIGRVSDGTRA